MIRETGYRLTCDTAFACSASLEGADHMTLFRQAEAAGWALRRKCNGDRALRGGKDFCPRHKAGSR